MLIFGFVSNLIDVIVVVVSVNVSKKYVTYERFDNNTHYYEDRV